MKEIICTCRVKPERERVKEYVILEMLDKSLICMDKRVYAGMLFVGRWCWNEMCVDVEGFDVDRSLMVI